MATPTGPRAQAARAFYRVRRRKLKQDEKAFINAGLAATPHDFGAQAAGAGSPNNLTLPANARFAVSHSVGLSPEDFSMSTFLGGEVGHDNAETTGANGIQEIRHYYPKNQDIHIFRRVGSLAGTLSVYFLGPNNTRTLIATATWI